MVRLTRLKRRRLALGLTLQDLAQKSGISARTISQWERGAREPRPQMIPRIALALEIEATELMEPEQLS